MKLLSFRLLAWPLFLLFYIIPTGILENRFISRLCRTCPVVFKARGEIRRCRRSLRKCAACLDSVIAYPAEPLGARARERCSGRKWSDKLPQSRSSARGVFC